MHLFLRLFSALISLSLILGGCAGQRSMTVKNEAGMTISTPISSGIEKISFKTVLTSGEKEYSGIMVIKKMADDEYRIAFFNEVGMSYLEGSFQGEEYPWNLSCNSVSPFLSSKKILNDLETALNLLLVPGESYKIEEIPSKIIFHTGKKRVFMTLTKI
jgi:hypothetical protein